MFHHHYYYWVFPALALSPHYSRPRRCSSTCGKEKYQVEQKRKLDQGLENLKVMNQKIDDLNYYKKNLKFDEKGEPDPLNKYVLRVALRQKRTST